MQVNPRPADEIGMRLLLISGLLFLSACGKAPEKSQITPSEYYVQDQWLACERVDATDPKCGVGLQCGSTFYDCQKQVIAR